jgi:hypothetical protein
MSGKNLSSQNDTGLRITMRRTEVGRQRKEEENAEKG